MREDTWLFEFEVEVLGIYGAPRAVVTQFGARPVSDAPYQPDGGARLGIDSFSGYRHLDEKSYCNSVNQGICDTITEGIRRRSNVRGDRTGVLSTPGVFHSVESRWAKFSGSSRPLNACEKKADAIDFHRKSQRNDFFRCECE